MINVKMWQGFTKRRNSTKIPDDTAALTVECVWKDRLSYANPVITIHTGDNFPWNYVRIDDIYYYVDDVISNPNGMWDVRLNLDYPATHRDSIFATKAFVEYYQGGSTLIKDNRLCPVTPTYGQSDTVKLDGLYNLETTYVVQTIGGSGIGQYYAVSSTQLRQLGNALYNADPAEVFAKWTSEYYTQSPESLIVSVDAYPFRIHSFCATNTETIKIGVLDSGVNGERIYGSTKKAIVMAMPPPHGGYTEEGVGIDIRNYKPYTTLNVYLPYVGTVEIDPELFFGTRSGLTLEYCVSYTSGKIFYRLLSNTINLGEYTGQAGTGATFGGANLSSNPTAATYVMPAFLQALSAIPVVGGLFDGFSDLLQQYGGTSGVATRGGGADTAEAAVTDGTCKLSVITVDTTYAPGAQASTIGLPYYRVATIGNLKGYCKCLGASVAVNNFYGNAQAVVSNMLNGGIYVE